METHTVKRYYDESAPQYDRWLRSFDRVMLGDARRRVCARAAGRTLEVAIGTGANIGHYRSGVELVGVDLSVGMLSRARARATELGRVVDLEIADAEQLPFPDESLDTVVATLLVSTVPDPRQALIEMHRVLEVGGRLLTLDMTRSPIALVRRCEEWLEPVTTKRSRFSLLRDPLDHLNDLGYVVESCVRSRFGIIQEVVARRR